MKYTRSRRLTARLAFCTLLSAAAALAAGACSKSTTQPSAPCVVTVGQVTAAVGAGGATGSIPVTAGSGCTWTATSGAAFITITAGASGSGNGTVQYTVAANTGAARTGTLTITGTTVTFTQAAGVIVVTPTLAAPSTQSPSGGQLVDSLTPTLVVANAAATGSVGSVTYRFEVSDADSFPDGSRTQVADAVAQGSTNTSWTVPQSLTPNTTYFWRARASAQNIAAPTAFSNVETFRTPNNCSFSLSATTITTTSAGGTSTVNVTAPGTCSWTATSNASFITITSGGSGTGNGTVTFTVAASSGAGRSGTLTIAGQTVTVNQTGTGVVASFNLLDPSQTAGATTECWFRSLVSAPSTCTLTSTSFTLGTTAVVGYSWTVQYTYGTVKTISGTNPQLSFSDVCGQVTSTNDGSPQPLNVTLTVTDSAGNTATATSGTGSQPALSVRLFACGV